MQAICAWMLAHRSRCDYTLGQWEPADALADQSKSPLICHLPTTQRRGANASRSLRGGRRQQVRMHLAAMRAAAVLVKQCELTRNLCPRASHTAQRVPRARGVKQVRVASRRRSARQTSLKRCGPPAWPTTTRTPTLGRVHIRRYAHVDRRPCPRGHRCRPAESRQRRRSSARGHRLSGQCGSHRVSAAPPFAARPRGNSRTAATPKMTADPPIRGKPSPPAPTIRLSG